jgi:hypothetical protein
MADKKFVWVKKRFWYLDPFHDNSLIAYYKFNNSLFEEINKITPTPHDILYTSAHQDQGLLFDNLNGTKRYFDTYQNYSTVFPISISFWVKEYNNELQFYKDLFGNYEYKNGSDKAIGWCVHLQQNGMNFISRSSNSSGSWVYALATCSTGKDLTDGNWHHIVVNIKDVDEMDLFVDTIQQTPNNKLAAAYVANSKNFRIGSQANLEEKAAQGVLDNFMIFNRTLTQSEVNILYSHY